MWTVFLKEVNAFLNSLIGYVVIVLFLTGIGLFVWVFPGGNVLDYGFASMDQLFNVAPFVYLFLIPAITMRSFAEEKREGTLEFLLTKPIDDLYLILGKYLAGVMLVLLSLLPTLVYYWTIYNLGNPVGNIDTAGVTGSYIGLFLLGAVFTSIGVFASSITDNQIVSFIVAVFLCFVLFAGFDAIGNIDVWGDYAATLIQLGINYHYDALSRGLVDSRNVLYFLSVIAIMLSATNLVLSSRRW